MASLYLEGDGLPWLPSRSPKTLLFPQARYNVLGIYDYGETKSHITRLPTSISWNITYQKVKIPVCLPAVTIVTYVNMYIHGKKGQEGLTVQGRQEGKGETDEGIGLTAYHTGKLIECSFSKEFPLCRLLNFSRALPPIFTPPSPKPRLLLPRATSRSTSQSIISWCVCFEGVIFWALQWGRDSLVKP